MFLWMLLEPPNIDKVMLSPPCNIIIKHVDKRVTGKDSATGQLIHSQDYSNTFYHPIAAHITKKNPLFFRPSLRQV